MNNLIKLSRYKNPNISQTKIHSSDFERGVITRRNYFCFWKNLRDRGDEEVAASASRRCDDDLQHTTHDGSGVNRAGAEQCCQSAARHSAVRVSVAEDTRAGG